TRCTGRPRGNWHLDAIVKETDNDSHDFSRDLRAVIEAGAARRTDQWSGNVACACAWAQASGRPRRSDAARHRHHSAGCRARVQKAVLADLAGTIFFRGAAHRHLRLTMTVMVHIDDAEEKTGGGKNMADEFEQLRRSVPDLVRLDPLSTEVREWLDRAYDAVKRVGVAGGGDFRMDPRNRAHPAQKT